MNRNIDSKPTRPKGNGGEGGYRGPKLKQLEVCKKTGTTCIDCPDGTKCYRGLE